MVKYGEKSFPILQAGEGVGFITSILNSPDVRFLMAASRPMGITLTPPTRSFPLICKVCWLLGIIITVVGQGTVGDQGPVWARSQSEERHHCVITHLSSNHYSNK